MPDLPEEENLDFLESRARMKRVLYAIIALIFGAIVLGVFLVSNPVFSSATAPAANAFQIEERLLYQHVKALTSTKSGHRHSGNLQGLHEAAAYISQQWKQMGLTPTEQKFQTPNKKEYKNIIATLGPKTGPRIIVGAHYDVCGNQAGADDNASGVAGLLELTRALKAVESKLKTRIDFVAYTLEEPPYFRTPSMGSAVHAKSMKAAKVDVRLMISLEMIGYFSDKPNSQRFPIAALGFIYPTVGNFIALVSNMTSDGYSAIRKLKPKMSSASTVPVHSINGPSSLPGLDFSDHLNYWAEGYPAVMVTDTSFFRNHHYHKPTDTITTLNFSKMSQVVRGVAWALVDYK